MILKELTTRAEGTTIRSQGHTMLSTLGHKASTMQKPFKNKKCKSNTYQG